MITPPANCPCMNPPFQRQDFAHRYLGMDETDGRFADVSLEQCTTCGSYWMHYGYSIEGFSGSGRWYRIQVDPEKTAAVKPEAAARLLINATWHFYGGSYYGTTGKRAEGAVSLR